MSKKNKKEDDLDTTTTFVDMNVEGFRWYDPSAKKSDGKRTHRQKLSRKEYWQLVRAAFSAYLPMFIILLASFGLMVLIAWLWVG